MNLEDIKAGYPFQPLGIFRTKLIGTLITVFIGFTVILMGFGAMIGFFVGLDNDPSDDGFGRWIESNISAVGFAYYLIWFVIIVIGIILIEYYTRSMSFQILEESVVVKKGILNKEEKHIPFRTITNVSSRYGLYDRFLGIGTVQIETAGKSGQSTAPEAKIEGITNYVAIRDIILGHLRKIRGQYATATELPAMEDSFSSSEQDFQSELLGEIKAIRELLSK